MLKNQLLRRDLNVRHASRKKEEIDFAQNRAATGKNPPSSDSLSFNEYE